MLLIPLKAGALLQLIWSSVTCWDMKPTLQSSFNLRTHTGINAAHRQVLYTLNTQRVLTLMRHVWSEAAGSLAHIGAPLQLHIRWGKAQLWHFPTSNSLMGGSQLEVRGFNLLSTSLHFPTLGRQISSTLRWYDSRSAANGQLQRATPVKDFIEIGYVMLMAQFGKNCVTAPRGHSRKTSF